MKRLLCIGLLGLCLLTGCGKVKEPVKNNILMTQEEKDDYVNTMRELQELEITDATEKKNELVSDILLWYNRESFSYLGAADVDTIVGREWYAITDIDYVFDLNVLESGFKVVKISNNGGSWDKMESEGNTQDITQETYTDNSSSGLEYHFGETLNNLENLSYIGEKEDNSYLYGYDMSTDRYVLVIVDNTNGHELNMKFIYSDSGTFEETSTSTYLVTEFILSDSVIDKYVQVIEQYAKYYNKNNFLNEFLKSVKSF